MSKGIWGGWIVEAHWKNDEDNAVMIVNQQVCVQGWNEWQRQMNAAMTSTDVYLDDKYRWIRVTS